jgi:tetratricopeptide (TPR) repeat protein
MKKTIFVILASALMMPVLKAQSIQEGLNHLYADRFQSAVGVFQKLLAQNPNNIEATYWLGQTYFDMDDNNMAKEVYEKGLASSNNAPLILVGMGHYNLLANKPNDARQQFETAITMSKDKKGKDNADILNAVGRAHTDAKSGDFKYAEQILKTATELNSKNPDIFLNYGNAIRKARPGEAGRDAYKAYQDALSLNPNLAYGYLRIAKLFETQRNWDLVLENLNKSVTVDPNFSLGYYELFYYYFPRLDFPNAENYFNKYVNSRPNEDKWEHDFLNAQLCWVKKDFDCAIAKGESVRALQGTKVKPRVLRLLAYAYLDKKDFAKAKAADDEFFAKEKDGFVAADYKRKAEIAAGSGVPCDQLYAIYMQGAAVDTVLQYKIDYMTDAAEDFKKRGCKAQEADMRLAIYNERKSPNPLGLINIGILYTQTERLMTADSIFTAFNTLMPDSIYGHYWRGKVNASIDTSNSIEPHVTNMVNGFTKALDIALTDTIRYKSLGTTSALTLIGYYYNRKGDKEAAKVVAAKGLALDTSNKQMQDINNLLNRVTPTKNQSGGGQKPSNNPPKSTGNKPQAATTPKSVASVQKTESKR